MSKPLSELFDGTKGAIAFRGDAEAIIASRVEEWTCAHIPLRRSS